MTDNALTTIEENAPATRLRDSAVSWDRSAGRLVPQTLGEVVQFAEAMSRGGIALRKHLRGNTGVCLAVALQAAEWQMSAFALANKSYAVNDQLAYEASVFAAVIIKFAPIKGRPKYSFEGEGDNRVCICTVQVEDGNGGYEPLEHRSPKFGKITPKNSPLWKIDPDQQQSYYTIRAMSRLHFPDITMGALDVDEAAAIREEPATSGLAARLPGGNLEGFSPDHALREIPAAEPSPEPEKKDTPLDAIAEAEPEIVDAVVEDHTKPDPEGAEAMAAPMEAEPDEWTVLENHEGPAPTGIVYLLAGDDIIKGRLQTWQDGEPFSTVTQKGAAQLPQYTEHPAPPEVTDPVEAATDAINQPAIEGETEVEGGILGEMRAADSWLQIKRLNAEFGKTPEWQQATDEDRDDMRRAIWSVVADLKKRTKDPVDHADDPSAFRLWLATMKGHGQDGANAIIGTLDVLKTGAGWKRLTDEQQARVVKDATDFATRVAGGF